MSLAATTFASLPELLRCLAEQTHSRKQLAALCLVNTTFNTAFSPFLHWELKLRDNDAFVDQPSSSYQHHVRSLVVSSSKDEPRLETIVLGLLPSMPRLDSFTWRNLPLSVTMMRKLHQCCPAIKALHISFPPDMGKAIGYSEEVTPVGWRMQERAVYGKPDMTVFPGLEELSLDELYEELPWWRAQIVQVLQNSPGLRKLKLSLSTKTLGRYDHDEEREKFERFFDLLCDDYGATGAAPLRLRSLHLGTAVYTFDVDSLTKLTDLAFLEEAHVENRAVWEGGVIIDMYDTDEEGSGIAFDAFGPARCPNLRRLNFADYQRDVHAFLAATADEDPSYTRRLAVSCQGTWSGYEPAALLRPDENYPTLPLHLRMMDIDLQRGQCRLKDEDGDDINACEIPPAREVLADLVAGDEGTLEGLAMHLKENPEAEGGFEHLDLLVNAVAQLDNLTQLAIEPNIHAERLIKDEEVLLKAATMLAAASRSLRYIKVYALYWRVWRDEDKPIRMEKLEDGEIDQVELFRGFIWQPQAC